MSKFRVGSPDQKCVEPTWRPGNEISFSNPFNTEKNMQGARACAEALRKMGYDASVSVVGSRLFANAAKVTVEDTEKTRSAVDLNAQRGRDAAEDLHNLSSSLEKLQKIQVEKFGLGAFSYRVKGMDMEVKKLDPLEQAVRIKRFMDENGKSFKAIGAWPADERKDETMAAIWGAVFNLTVFSAIIGEPPNQGIPHADNTTAQPGSRLNGLLPK